MIKHTGHVVIMRNEVTGDIKHFYFPIPEWVHELDRICDPPSFELSVAYGEAVNSAIEQAPCDYEVVSVIAV